MVQPQGLTLSQQNPSCLWNHNSTSPKSVYKSVCVCVTVSRSVMFDSLQSHGLYIALQRLLYPWNSLRKILEWIAVHFSRGSSWPRDQTQVSCVAGRFFTIWATREALKSLWWRPDSSSIQATVGNTWWPRTVAPTLPQSHLGRSQSTHPRLWPQEALF